MCFIYDVNASSASPSYVETEAARKRERENVDRDTHTCFYDVARNLLIFFLTIFACFYCRWADICGIWISPESTILKFSEHRKSGRRSSPQNSAFRSLFRRQCLEMHELMKMKRRHKHYSLITFSFSVSFSLLLFLSSSRLVRSLFAHFSQGHELWRDVSLLWGETGRR